MNNPRPEVWEKTLCDGRSFKIPNNKDIPEAVGRLMDCSRKANKSLGYCRGTAPFIEIVGKSKLR